MGITDYGVNASGVTYSESPYVVESFLDVNSLVIYKANGGGCLDPAAVALECFTAQENSIVRNVYVSNDKGVYWIQNIAEVAYDASCSSPCVSGDYSVTFLDNIWNFSYAIGGCPSDLDSGPGCINPAYVVGNYADQCVYAGGYPEFYYCQGPTTYGLLPPFTIWTWTDVNSYGDCTTAGSFACVNFWGSVIVDGNYATASYYDGVSFYGGTHKQTSARFYVHDSNTPLGLPYDFEWVLGGPADGSSIELYILSDMQSYYSSKANGSSLESILHAWSSGRNTAETTKEVYMFDPGGDRPGLAQTTFAGDNPGVALW